MTPLPRQACVIGCGVIGAAWAARMRLSGIDVRACDPAPNARATLEAVYENAVLAWQDLGLDISQAGNLEFCGSVAEAAKQAEWVQESVPERLELKQGILAQIEAAARPDALIGSSTSGFRPTVMASGMRHPGRLLVAHPFNPVYLIPLVEIVGNEHTPPALIDQAKNWYASLGMKPLHVRKEIDAFIADRLLESVWRECLWLINDGIATTGEIDDAIRYGFGLRWAQMGIFDTYRIAGGEGGMQHFLAQFGDSLNWPWSHMTDTPELDHELVNTIATQSDQQSGHLSIREMERVRDRNLAAILKALEKQNWGAGLSLAALRKRLQ